MKRTSQYLPAVALAFSLTAPAQAENTCSVHADVEDPAGSIRFTAEILKNAAPGDKDPINKDHLLVFECPVARWGAIRSMEFGTYRDGGRVYDIDFRTMGVNPDRGDPMPLKFQLWDAAVEKISAHSYKVDAKISFLKPQK